MWRYKDVFMLLLSAPIVRLTVLNILIVLIVPVFLCGRMNHASH